MYNYIATYSRLDSSASEFGSTGYPYTGSEANELGILVSRGVHTDSCQTRPNNG